MKISAIIQARMGSSRLPGKILNDLQGKPMLECMVERVRRSKRVDDICVATTVEKNDDATQAACEKMGVRFFRGSSEDVLQRVVLAAQAIEADIIVELTGDCPLMDPVEIDRAVQFYLDHQKEYDYVSNFLKRTYPRGLEIQVFSRSVLEEVERKTQDPADREHVSLYIYEHPAEYRCGNVKAPAEAARGDLRLTVDTTEDFQLIEAIYAGLYPQQPDFSIGKAIQFLNQNPSLLELNSEIRQKPVR